MTAAAATLIHAANHRPGVRFASVLRLAALLWAASTLAACSNVERLSRIGEDPGLSEVQNPAALASHAPVAMPMPKAVPQEQQANSLWRPGSRAFFKDQRASDVGDILTVVIVIVGQPRQRRGPA